MKKQKKKSKKEENKKEKRCQLTINGKKCLKLLEKHAKCYICTKLIHGKEAQQKKCTGCNKKEESKNMKSRCTTCHKPIRKHLKNYLDKGNYCSKCNAEASTRIPKEEEEIEEEMNEIMKLIWK
jgi:hypothetical protein